VLINDHATHGAIEIESGCLPGFSSDFNAVKDRFSLDDTWMTLAQWRAATGQDVHSFVGTPALFASAAGGDYTLKAGSAAVDAGTAQLAPDDDLPGQQRPAGAGFDIGAFESLACYGSQSGYGAGLAGSGGVLPTLALNGCPDLGTSPSLVLAGGLGGAPALLLLGTAAESLPKWGGTLLVAPTLSVLLPLSGPAGVPGAGGATLVVHVPALPSLVGQSARLQLLVADAGAPAGVALSAGLLLQPGAPEP